MKKILLITGLLLTIMKVNAQTKEDVLKIQQASNLKELSSLFSKYTEMDRIRNERVKELAKQNNWPIIRVNPDRSFDQLIDVSEDGKPIYYTIKNVNAAKSTRTNHLNTGGSLGLNLNGQGITAYVWDGGPVRTSHQEFGGRVNIGDGITSLNTNSWHATHVTGTIGAAGVATAAKGMAPQVNCRTHEWNSDLTEATTAAINGMLLSNHSYGYDGNLIPDWYFGAYIGVSRNWDNLMFNAPYYLMVNSAGNDGINNSYNALPLNGNAGFDKLSGQATSKNSLVVANAQDANVNVSGNLISVAINTSSSQGPTDDLRIKPDITGNGTSVYSSLDGSNIAYGNLTGTSMASPNVTGTLALLQQYNNSISGNFMRAATLKGLVLHTADAAGPSGPDVIWGWGLLNAKRAAETITQNGTSSIINELTLSQGQTQSFSVISNGISPLLASISWTDPGGVANSGTPNLTTPILVNDLDIRVTKNLTTYFPYRLTSITTNNAGDNIVDPYERVDIAGASGTYIITVTHKGTLANGSQKYSLVVTGLGSCASNITISGSYSTALTESQTWIKSTGQTTISNTGSVKLDADPTNGYVLLMPANSGDFFLSAPTGSGVFIAQALDGCGNLIPMIIKPRDKNPVKKIINKLNRQ
jgi:trimeric autotransporter adhesin